MSSATLDGPINTEKLSNKDLEAKLNQLAEEDSTQTNREDLSYYYSLSTRLV